MDRILNVALFMCNTTRIPPCRNRLVPSCASPEVTLNGCSFPLFVIPGLTRNPVFLNLKDQKIALPEQRVSNLEKENDLLKQYE
jgi:hypothetical protein